MAVPVDGWRPVSYSTVAIHLIGSIAAFNIFQPATRQIKHPSEYAWRLFRVMRLSPYVLQGDDMFKGRWIALNAFVLLLSACVSSEVDVGYKRRDITPTASANPVVAVGSFQDRRKFESNYLGAIRGGFGNPLKKLTTPVPVSEVVRQSFRDGLAARGLLSQTPDAPYTLSGVVEQYDCNQVGRREAHAKILIYVTETSSGRQIMAELFRRDKVTGSMITFDAGIFASTEDLRVLAAEVLQEVVDEALDGFAFQQIVTRSRPASVPDSGG
jgi:hypothetical protein